MTGEDTLWLMHIADEKARVREAMKERLQHLPEPERAAESRSLCRRLLAMLPKDATVCGYAAMRNEAQLDFLLQALLDQGNRVFLPRFERQTLVFRQCLDLQSLQKGPLGVREPAAEAPLLPDDAVDLTVIVPGVAFDRRGGRLGRGKGGYDRWIADQRAKSRSLRCIGAALACQLLEQVPAEPHDQRMDGIATARELLMIEQ